MLYFALPENFRAAGTAQGVIGGTVNIIAGDIAVCGKAEANIVCLYLG